MSNLLRLKELEARTYPLLPPVLRPIVQDLLFAEMFIDLEIYGHGKSADQQHIQNTFHRLEVAIKALEINDRSRAEILQQAQTMTDEELKDVLAMVHFLRARHDMGKIVRGAFQYAMMRVRKACGLS